MKRKTGNTKVALLKKLNYSGIPIKGNENWFEKSGKKLLLFGRKIVGSKKRNSTVLLYKT